VARAVVEAPVRGYDEQLWSQVKAFIYYAKLMFVPRGLSVDHQFQLSSSIVDPYAASALALLASISVIVWRLGRRWPEAPFYALWALVGLLPASLIPLNVIVNEHRLYLAGVAFAIACACLTGRSQTRPAVGRGMGTAIVLLAVLAFQRGDAWASTESLWEDAASKGPAMARPWFLLGTEYLHQGRIGEGMAAVERAVERDPNLLAAHVTLAETARQQAFVADADRSWWERSARAYERAIELAPDDLSLRGNLGNTYQELGRADLALPHHRRATAMDPANPETRLNLGNTYLMLDRLKEAEVEYGAVLELAPEYSEAWRNLSVLYTRSGRAQDAAQAAAAAARIETHR
jgi:Tfp pilus assembly protein PilF